MNMLTTVYLIERYGLRLTMEQLAEALEQIATDLPWGLTGLQADACRKEIKRRKREEKKACK